MSTRGKNIQLFEESKHLWETNIHLQKHLVTCFQNQKFVGAKEELEYAPLQEGKVADVIVSRQRTLEAAERYVRSGKKTCVLNFASATNPGGGVIRGSSAQEECLCRCSTLYPCLNTKYMWGCFYSPHRNDGSPLHNDDCIYTPDVCVFREDTAFPKLLPEAHWWNVNVISCAAPNLRRTPSNVMNPHAGSSAAQISRSELELLLTSRIRRLFTLAAMEGNEVLILGAFGCGAFRNPPEVVAKVFKAVMQEYRFCFETIEYAIYCNDWDMQNYEVFRDTMKDYCQRT